MKEKDKKKSHRVLKFFLGLLVVVFVASISLAIWQRENISAFIKAQQQTKESIAEEISASKANTQKEIEKYNIPIKRDFTLEEEEAIRQGTLSVEEAVSRIMGTDSAGVAGTQSDSQQGEASGGEVSSQGGTVAGASSTAGGSNGTASSTGSGTYVQELTKEQQIVADGLTELYSLKAYYIGQLGVVESDLKAQYKAEVGTTFNTTAVAKIVQKNMSRIAGLESECDTKVYKVLDDMRSELNAIGADTGIVDIAEDSYVNEKGLRKSYYLSLYK